MANKLATTAGNAVAQQGPRFSDWINSAAAQKSIANTFQDPKRRQRFVSSLISAVTNNPALQDCSFVSILSASLLGESLNLSHSQQLGQYYMVPYEDRKAGTKKATFILGYRGLVQLALRSGYYKKLNVLPIKEGELVRYDPLNEEIEVNLIEDAGEREKAKTVGYYAMFEYLNGFRKAMYWTKEKMLAHADRYSQAFSKDGTDFKTSYGMKHKVSFEEYEAGNYPKNDEWMYSSFWYKDFDGMARKTMLRQLISQWGIMSVEMQDAIVNDIQTEEKEDNSGEEFDLVFETGVPEEPVPVDEDTGEVKPKKSGKKQVSMEDL